MQTNNVCWRSARSSLHHPMLLLPRILDANKQRCAAAALGRPEPPCTAPCMKSSLFILDGRAAEAGAVMFPSEHGGAGIQPNAHTTPLRVQELNHIVHPQRQTLTSDAVLGRVPFGVA